MPGLPRKNSEFLAIYRKDIEEIIKPYGFEYEDRDEYYGSKFSPAEKWRAENFLYHKHMPYGGIYLLIGSCGRLSQFDLSANFKPAVKEVANIEKEVYGEIGIAETFNVLQWQDGGKGLEFNLLSSTHIIQDVEEYQDILNVVQNNLDKYLALTTVRQLFEMCLSKANYYGCAFNTPQIFRLGYWLIMAKLAGEDYYAELADEYVEINQEKIQKEFNVDITQLKEFLDTYTVGSLA